MDNLGFALLHYRIHFSHSRLVLLLCSPLLLLMLAVIPAHWGALMPTMRQSLSRVFQAGGPSTSAFFLLNALILTIIGSCKLDQAARTKLGVQELEGSNIALPREAVGPLQEDDGSRGAVHAENASRTDVAVAQNSVTCPSILTSGHGNDQHVSYQRRNLLLRSRSLSASDDHLSEKTRRSKQAEAVTAVVNDQRKPFNSTSLRLARNYNASGREKARLPIPLNPLRAHGLERNKQLMIGSFSNDHAVGEAGSHAIEPASKKSPMIHANKARRARRPNNSMDHPAPALEAQLVPVAAARHSSFEDVWAGILAANVANSQLVHAAKPSYDEGSSRGNTTQPPAAAAVPFRRLAEASEPGVPPPSTASAANAPKEAARSGVAAAENAALATETAEVEEKKTNATDDEHDSELEELNRRAEKFIARFNHQMRIQRQESLQRKTRSRPCNHYIQHVSNYHVQHPSPGLLVG